MGRTPLFLCGKINKSRKKFIKTLRVYSFHVYRRGVRSDRKHVERLLRFHGQPRLHPTIPPPPGTSPASGTALFRCELVPCPKSLAARSLVFNPPDCRRQNLDLHIIAIFQICHSFSNPSIHQPIFICRHEKSHGGGEGCHPRLWRRQWTSHPLAMDHVPPPSHPPFALRCKVTLFHHRKSPFLQGCTPQ